MHSLQADVEWLLFFRIPEPPSSNPGTKTGISDREFSWFSVSPWKHCADTLNQAATISLMCSYPIVYKRVGKASLTAS